MVFHRVTVHWRWRTTLPQSWRGTSPYFLDSLSSIDCINFTLPRTIRCIVQVGLLNVDGYFDAMLTLFDKALDEGFLNVASHNIVVSAPTATELLDKLKVRQASQFLWWHDIHMPLNYLSHWVKLIMKICQNSNLYESLSSDAITHEISEIVQWNEFQAGSISILYRILGWSILKSSNDFVTQAVRNQLCLLILSYECAELRTNCGQKRAGVDVEGNWQVSIWFPQNWSWGQGFYPQFSLPLEQPQEQSNRRSSGLSGIWCDPENQNHQELLPWNWFV